MKHQDMISFSQRGVGPIVKATNAGKVSIMPDLPQDAAEEDHPAGQSDCWLTVGLRVSEMAKASTMKNA
jgi:hypothetical protein